MSSPSRLSFLIRPLLLIWASFKGIPHSPSSLNICILINKIEHYVAFKEAVRKDGIASLAHPLPTVDMRTGENVDEGRYERSDVCVVPAGGVVGEAMLGSPRGASFGTPVGLCVDAVWN